MTCKLAQEIMLGRHDDDLPDIVKAVGERAVATSTQVAWRLRYEDIEVTELDLTLNELERVETLSGKTWWRIDPRNRNNSSAVPKALIRALLESRKGMSPEDAEKKVGEHTVRDLVGAFDEVVVPAPFEDPSADMS